MLATAALGSSQYTRPGLPDLPQAADITGEGKHVSWVQSWQWELTRQSCRRGALAQQWTCVYVPHRCSHAKSPMQGSGICCCQVMVSCHPSVWCAQEITALRPVVVAMHARLVTFVSLLLVFALQCIHRRLVWVSTHAPKT
jgi:hypothetical protein